MQASLNLSVIIITLNEEEHITSCIQHLPEGSEIIILDSGSTDHTKSLATKLGAKVYHRDFDDFASQKNAAIKLASKQWILSLDADEIISQDLKNEIVLQIKDNHICADAFRIHRKLVFMKKQLRYGKSQDQPIRLFRKNKAHFSKKIHEHLIVQGSVAKLTGSIKHYSYDSITDYFSRFNAYTSQISREHFFGKTPIPGKIPHAFRPWYEFVNRYIFRLGFLDGYPGYCYALFSSIYAFVKYAKLLELYQNQAGKQKYELKNQAQQNTN